MGGHVVFLTILTDFVEVVSFRKITQFSVTAFLVLQPTRSFIELDGLATGNLAALVFALERVIQIFDSFDVVGKAVLVGSMAIFWNQMWSDASTGNF